MSSSATPIFIFGVIGFFIGLLVGEFVQIVVMYLSPEIISAIVDTFAVEGPLKEPQDSIIDTARIAIDMAFGLGGAGSLVGLRSIFRGRQS